jgi:poly-gamma-glutamate capsule biosynthesis protein CapA/YwtB (metallophosphatase superfamily)
MTKKSFTIAMMGDAMLDRKVGKHFSEAPDDFKFSQLKERLKAFDLVFLNLENPVGINGEPDSSQNPHVTFCSHPDSLKILHNLGVNIVSLGNNHMLDYGETALSETLQNLDNEKIKHAGAGMDFKQANQPLLFECNGKKIAMLSHVFIYSASTLAASNKRAGVSHHQIDPILKLIEQLKQQGYVILVTLHWGQEYSFYPIPYQSEQARNMIDQGASLIIGHGPHYPQGFENYKHGQIIYSLGNFIFDEPYLYANRSFIYTIEITEDNNLINPQILPFKIINHVPVLLEGKQKQQLINRINALTVIYQRKSPQFWKKISNLWFRDIIARVFRSRSLKFLGLPPKSFYLEINYFNYIVYFFNRAFSKLVAIIRA